METKYIALTLLIVTAACSGTGAQHQPVLSAAPDATYDADLAQCQSLAKSQKLWNPETRTKAVIGATLGALAGSDGNSGDVAAGAIIGAASGATAGALDMRDTRKNVLLNCLRDRGHPVAG